MKRVGLYLFLILSAINLSAQNRQGIEPPFWWVGMEDPTLQLMMPIEDNPGLTISVYGSNVVLESVDKSENRKYAFLNLRIPEDAEPGYFDIVLSLPNGIGKREYELKERKPNSAQRRGFNTDDVVYLITPDRFANGDLSNDVIRAMREGLDRSLEYGRHGGDIQGVIDNLDYIADMGFTSIWLNPVLENDQDTWSYHGYATTDFYKVDPRFGTNELYKELCDKAAEKGIGVIMDQIANHCGSFHPWHVDPPFSDWFNKQGQPFEATNHRKLSVVDPYRSQIDRDQMVQGWFVKPMPDLNQHNPFMAKYLIQNSIWWIEYAGLHGVRQDTYSYPYADFMRDWTCAILNEYPNFNIVGEEWIDDPALISYWQRGKKNHDGYTSCLPSLMDFPTLFDLKKALVEKESWGEGLIKLYENLSADYLYPDPQRLMIFADNHDISRITEELNNDETLIKMAMVYILTMRGIPQIYYGTEILMNHPGTDSHGAIRTDFPGGWQGDTSNAFTGENLTEQQKAFQNWLKQLLKWRKTEPAIHHGLLTHYNPIDGVYVYFRFDEGSKIMVILNKNDEPYNLDLTRFKESMGDQTQYQDVLNKKKGALGKEFKLEQKGAYILELF